MYNQIKHQLRVIFAPFNKTNIYGPCILNKNGQIDKNGENEFFDQKNYISCFKSFILDIFFVFCLNGSINEKKSDKITKLDKKVKMIILTNKLKKKNQTF